LSNQSIGCPSARDDDGEEIPTRPSPTSVVRSAARRRTRAVALAAHTREDCFTRALALALAREVTSIARDMTRRRLAPK
jgi:hypothetical protein